MKEQVHEAVETEIGTLHGRACIDLDVLHFEPYFLVAEGSIDADAKQPTETRRGSFRYRLTFQRVLAFKVIELDSWEDMGYSLEQISSFDEIINSRWIAKLAGKTRATDRHYCVATYDYVIDVVCEGFDLALEPETD